MCDENSHYVSDAESCQPSCNDRIAMHCNKATWAIVQAIESKLYLTRQNFGK